LYRQSVKIGALFEYAIEARRLLQVALVDRRNSAFPFQPEKHISKHIHAEGRDSIREGSRFRMRSILEKIRDILPPFLDQSLLDDYDRHTARPEVLLCSRVDQTKLADIDRTAHDVARHVGNNGDTGA